MAVTPKTLIPAKQAEAGQTTQYTAVNCTTIIDKFTATNTSGGNVTLTVNLIVDGGAAATSNTISSARAIAAGEAYTFPEIAGHILDSGGYISTIASSANSLTIRASGREIVN